MTEIKPWVCDSCGIQIGTIEYHSSVPTLRLQGILIVGEAEMMCDCGRVMVWHPNSAALSHLFKQRKLRQAAIRQKLNELDTVLRG